MMSTFVPCDIGLPPHFTSWRSNQLDAANFMVDSPERFVALCAPTGFGKSLAYMAAAYLSGKRTVVLTSTKGLQDQIARDFESVSQDIRGMQNYSCSKAESFGMNKHTRVNDAPCHHGASCSLRSGGCGYFDQYRAAQSADIVVTNYQCWLYDALKQKGNLASNRHIDMLILDECFSAGTMIGSKPIEDFLHGESVNTFNEQSKRFEKSSVLRAWRRPAPSKMCRLYFADGSHVNCTLNHPFYTDQGWLPAYRLLLGNVLCLKHATKNLSRSNQDGMRELQKAHGDNGLQDEIQLPLPWPGSLFNGMRFASWFAQKQPGSSGTITTAYVETQSHEECRDQSQDAGHTPGNGLEANSTRRERSGAVHLSEVASFDIGLADGSGNQLGTEEAFFSDVLQGRYSGLCFASCNRSGREKPLLAPEVGCQEGAHAYWTRVDGFEIYERSDREGFRSVCPDGYVYNLAVEGTHTYTANGFVVHNCHDAGEQLSSYLSVTLERKDCLSLAVTWPPSGYNQAEWRDWAAHWEDKLDQRIESLKEQLSETGMSHTLLHEIKVTKELQRKIERVSLMQDEWMIEELDRHGDEARTVKFDPLWPRKYAETHLFRGIDKVVLVSATVREKTAELLGIPAHALAFKEFPSSFPVENRPVIHVPTVRMNYRNEADDDQMMWFLRKLDLLLDSRSDRKGVIHSVSYKRARFILDNSRHAAKMMVHGSDTRAGTIQRFLAADPSTGAILVSPSVDTGYDFNGTAAEYQIICKLPFPDTRGTVMRARCREDKDYSAYLTAQTIQQMTGRVCRSETDRGETLVTDDNCVWMVPRYRKYFNGWWLSSFYTQKGKLPEPLPKL